MRVRVTKSGGWDVTPMGNPLHFPEGDYTVGGDDGMTEELADRLIRSKCGVELNGHESKEPDENKAARPTANKATTKKKRSTKKRGRPRSS